MSLRRSRIPKFIPIISLLILLVLGPIVFSFLQNASKVEAGWVDDNFSYRNAIPITSHTAAESNVYVTATIDTSASGQFQADCGDLRFTTVGGDILPYYIVSGCVSASTVVHVFFKSMPAGAQTIYYYYGNPSATNGYASADFATVASSYALGSVASQEKGGAPIAYWKFDDGTGTNAQDSSSNGATGTITNAVWKTDDLCLSGKCLYLDGTGDYIDAGDKDYLDFSGTSSFSLSVWVKPTVIDSTYRRMISKEFTDGSGRQGYLLWIQNTALGFERFLNGSRDFSSYTGLTLNTFSHVVATYDGSNMKLYVNGNLVNTGGSSKSMVANTATIRIGGSSAGGSEFAGYVDEPKIYNYARTAAQIKSDFKSRGTSKGISVAAGSSRQNSDALSNGLVGYWKMDEVSGAGSTLADSSGNSNTGTAVLWGGGNTSTDSAHVAGKYGNSFSFDGGDDNVTVTDVASLQAGATMTISSWFKLNATASDKRFVDKTNNGTGYSLAANTTTPRFITGNGSTYDNLDGTTTLATGTWYHMVGTVENGTKRIYVNGNLENTASITFNGVGTGVNFRIGARAASQAVNASIDEIRLYNRALSPREVRDLYAFAPGPVGYWNMDEKTGGNAYDKSGNGNTGTITAATWSTGKFGGGLQFNGSTTWVETALSPAVPASRNYTQSLWFYPTSATDGILIDDYNRWEHYIQMNSNRTVKACYYDVSTVCATSTNTITLNTWNHVAAVIDSGNSINVYVNGILWAQNASLGGIQSRILNDVVIGAGGNTHPTPFTGYIDDVKIYNYARTQKQIVEDMNAGHPVGGSPVGSQVGYWKMDEGYGSTVSNSGNGVNLNGTITGATWNNNGKFNKALQFVNGSNTWVVIPSDASLRFGSGGMTLSAWIKTSATGITQNIIRKDNGAGLNGYILRIETDNRLRISFLDGTGGQTTYATAGLVTDGVWHHVAATLDRTLAKQYLFVDGKQVNSTSTTLSDDNVSYTVKIGGTVASEALTGLIDEVKIYNSALTEDEIKLDYNRGQAMVLGTTGDASSSAGALYCQPGSSDTCNPPVGEWNFEERSGQTVNDISGNGYLGTLGADSSVASDDPTWTDGILGKALRYDGSDDYVAIPYQNIGTALTYEVWFKSTNLDTTTDRNLFSYMSTLIRLRSNQIQWYPDVNLANTTVSTTVSNNRWNQIAVNQTGTTYSVYLNGVLISTGTTTSSVSVNTTSLSNRINSYSGTANLAGSIDDVRIYNYARSAAQVAWDYNQGKPIAQWKMDECQGGSVFDASGNGNTGTITIGATGTQTAVGTCTTSGTAWYNGVTGKFNSSLNFDGTDDNISVTDPPSGILDFGTNDFSVSAWIKNSQSLAADGDIYTIVGKFSDNALPGWSFVLRGNTYKGLLLRVGATDGLQDVTPTSSQTTLLSNGNWHHVFFRRTGGVGTLFIDGTNVGTGTSTKDVSNASNLRFGQWAQGSSFPFNGQIDDVRIYNYALTATQVKNLFNGGAGIRFGPTTGSP